jgi:hypothetical protein
MFLDTYVDEHRFEPLREVILEEGQRIGRDMSDFGWLAFASGQVTDAAHPRSTQNPRPTLTGTPEQILTDLERFAEARYSHVTVFFDIPSGSMDDYMETVERFGKEVIPEAKGIKAAAFV